MKRMNKLIFAVFFGLIVAVIMYAASQTVLYRPFLRIQNTIDDSHFIHRFMLKGTDKNLKSNIVIVDIDDRSIKSLGAFKLWRRHRFAHVIEMLNSEGVRLIFLDALLIKGGSDDIFNKYLANTINHAGNVLAGYYFSLDDMSTKRRPPDTIFNQHFSSNWLNPQSLYKNEFIKADRVIVPYSDDFFRSVKGLGFTNYVPDPDGILRHIPLYIAYKRRLYPSASLQIWLHLKGLHSSQVVFSPEGIRFGKTFIPTDKHCFMRLNFIASQPVYPYVSFMDVLERNFEPGMFRNKIVMIGSSSKILGDLKRIPGYGSLPGVEIHAAALSTLLDEKFLTVLSGNIIFLISIVCGVLSSVLFSFAPPVRVGLPVAICVPLVLYMCAIYVFTVHSRLINISLPSFVVLLLYIVIVIHHFVEKHERKTSGENVS